ncbi:MAG: DUF4198 domain-containing protein [Sphaerochaetaceae bacterium]|nr:DUF4198 domain-containing protein [Sphaerochaetaceae bacterium]
MQVIKNITLTILLSASSLSAHAFWVNSFESFHHKPGHTTVSLGWGHSLPIDDILNSPNGKVIVQDFAVTTPSGKKIDLDFPKSENSEASEVSDNFDVFKSDIGLQKIALKKDSQKGVYLIQAKTEPTYYTMYTDTKDRERLKLKPLDKIKDIKKVKASIKYQAFASSYLTIGEWETPKPTGTDLEIRPLSDLSNVKVGDLLEFEVTFKGKPLSRSEKSLEFIRATSKRFGQGEKFFIASYLEKGKAQFRVQSKGQWIVDCYHKEEVTKDGVLKDLYGKATHVMQGASLTFNVKE